MRAVGRQILILVLITAAGCQRESVNRSLRPVKVEVIVDAAEVDAARKAWAADRERKLEALLKAPQEIRSYDKEGIGLLKEHRDRSLSALAAVRDDASKPPKVRIEAMVALRFLDVSPAPDALTQLAQADKEAGYALLVALDDLYPAKTEIPEPIKRFVLTAMGSSDSRLRNQATQFAAWRRLEGASEIVAARMRGESKPDLALLRAAAVLAPSPAILQLLQSQLRSMDSFESGGTLGILVDLGKATNNPALQQQVARVCVDYLRRQPDQPWIDTQVYSVNSMIAGLQPPEQAAALLTELIRSSKWRLLRVAALHELEKLDESAARKLAAETGLKLLSESKSAGAASGQTAEQLAAICTKHDLLTAAECDRALAERRQRLASGAEPAKDSVEGLLLSAHRFLVFDAETDTVPNRHDLLIMDFAEASAGLFRPEAAFEHYGPTDTKKEGHWAKVGDGAYSVQFLHNGKLYRFKPNDLGDWYDVTAVVDAIHRALEDAGVTERFVALDGGGQDMAFIFANAGALKAAAPELHLKLSGDPDQGRKSGKAAEEQILEILKQ